MHKEINEPDRGSSLSMTAKVERVILPAILILSVAMNCLLILKVKHLVETITFIKSEGGLMVGTKVPTIEGRTPDGSRINLAFDSTNKTTVLYIFTPQCTWCKRNLANLQALAAQQNSTYRLIGLSLTSDGLEDYIRSNHLTFPVYTDLSSQTLRDFHLGGTPATIVVSPSSQVSGAWTGAYQADVKNSVQAVLHISLPGCCSN